MPLPKSPPQGVRKAIFHASFLFTPTKSLLLPSLKAVLKHLGSEGKPFFLLNQSFCKHLWWRGSPCSWQTWPWQLNWNQDTCDNNCSITTSLIHTPVALDTPRNRCWLTGILLITNKKHKARAVYKPHRDTGEKWVKAKLFYTQIPPHSPQELEKKRQDTPRLTIWSHWMLLLLLQQSFVLKGMEAKSLMALKQS